jgi:hypothetical protein
LLLLLLPLLLSTGADVPQTCSPIMEISISWPHDEHLMVGMKVDSRGAAAIVPVGFGKPEYRRFFSSLRVLLYNSGISKVDCAS